MKPGTDDLYIPLLVESAKYAEPGVNFPKPGSSII